VSVVAPRHKNPASPYVVIFDFEANQSIRLLLNQANPLVAESRHRSPILFVASPCIPLKHIVSQMPNHGLCSTMNTIFLPYLMRF